MRAAAILWGRRPFHSREYEGEGSATRALFVVRAEEEDDEEQEGDGESAHDRELRTTLGRGNGAPRMMWVCTLYMVRRVLGATEKSTSPSDGKSSRAARCPPGRRARDGVVQTAEEERRRC